MTRYLMFGGVSPFARLERGYLIDHSIHPKPDILLWALAPPPAALGIPRKPLETCF